MIGVLLVGVAAGTACGLARLKIWSLILVTIVFSMITVVAARVTGLGAGTIALTLFTGVTLLQLFYFIGLLVVEERKQPATSPKPWRPDVVRALQSAIGQEMRMSCPLPVDLPPQLEARFAQLTARYG
jgi:hypothetical protein